MEKTNILFMCRANCFRSKIAEAYFNKINKNNNIKVNSAGIVSGYEQSENQIKICKEFGINIKGKSQGITKDLFIWADILIIVADDVPSEIFDYEKRNNIIKGIIRWNIKDAQNNDNIDIKRAIKQLMKKNRRIS